MRIKILVATLLAAAGTALIIAALSRNRELRTSALNSEDHAALVEPQTSVLNHNGHFTSKEFETSCGPAARHKQESPYGQVNLRLIYPKAGVSVLLTDRRKSGPTPEFDGLVFENWPATHVIDPETALGMLGCGPVAAKPASTLRNRNGFFTAYELQSRCGVAPYHKDEKPHGGEHGVPAGSLVLTYPDHHVSVLFSERRRGWDNYLEFESLTFFSFPDNRIIDEQTALSLLGCS